MSDGNGYDARGEDSALHRRLGAVETREIMLAAAVSRLDTMVADLRDEIVGLRGEVRRSFEKADKLLEAIAATVGAL